MLVNRMREYRQIHQAMAEPATVVAPHGFVACPVYGAFGMAGEQWAWQQQIYRLAYQLAVENCVPSHYRRLFSNWN